MATMLAAILERPGPVEQGPLTVARVEIPRPGPGEVLIRVSVCGICRTDLHVVEGELPTRKARLIPGHQAVGVVERMGPPAGPGAGVGVGVRVGDRVGAAWLRWTCGECRFCRAGRENLCERAEFNGWTADGGFSQYMTAPAAFVYRMEPGVEQVQTAPLLCAGIIGYRSMRLTGLEERPGGWRGARLGIYGFGAAGHIVIQLARARGAEVYVFTRDRERHRALATELGAAWVGDASETPPAPLDAGIIFAPAGELVPPALEALEKGGTLVLGGIHMSDVPRMKYGLLYGERVVRSVANNTREDGRGLLEETARVGVTARAEIFELARVNEALQKLKHDGIKGAAVLRLAEG